MEKTYTQVPGQLQPLMGTTLAMAKEIEAEDGKSLQTHLEETEAKIGILDADLTKILEG